MKILMLSFLLLLSATETPTSMDAFSQQAKEQHKAIAVYFSGSDWCTNCHQFTKAILTQDSVKSLLDQHFVYYVADFPQRKKQAPEIKAMHEALAEKLNPEGHFPLLVITDENWNTKAVIRKGEDISHIIAKLQANIQP